MEPTGKFNSKVTDLKKFYWAINAERHIKRYIEIRSCSRSALLKKLAFFQFGYETTVFHMFPLMDKTVVVVRFIDFGCIVSTFSNTILKAFVVVYRNSWFKFPSFSLYQKHITARMTNIQLKIVEHGHRNRSCELARNVPMLASPMLSFRWTLKIILPFSFTRDVKRRCKGTRMKVRHKLSCQILWFMCNHIDVILEG